MFAYAKCVEELLSAGNVPKVFRGHQIEAVADLYTALSRSNVPDRIAETFASALAQINKRQVLCGILEDAGRTEPHKDFAKLAGEIRRLAK